MATTAHISDNYYLYEFGSKIYGCSDSYSRVHSTEKLALYSAMSMFIDECKKDGADLCEWSTMVDHTGQPRLVGIFPDGTYAEVWAKKVNLT